MPSKALLLFISVVSIAFGQESGKPDRFTTMDACKAAVMSGDFHDYVPSFTSSHREPGDDEDVRPLEERACVDLHIVGGRGFVPQAKGEKYIFNGAQIVARYDCGNEAKAIEYVPVQVAVAPPPPAPVTPAPPPAPVACSCPPPVEVVDIRLPEYGDSIALVDMPEPLEVLKYWEVVAKIPPIGFCDTRHGWKEFFQGMAEPFVCSPGQTTTLTILGSAGGFGLNRAFPKVSPAPKAPLVKDPACVPTINPQGIASTCPVQ